jgi:hypothetical protein
VTPRHPDTDRPLRDGPNTHVYRDAGFVTEWTVVPLTDPDGVDHLFHVPSIILDMERQLVAADFYAGVRLPAEPEAPDLCDGCGASRLSMRHYIGCPMVATHRWDPVLDATPPPALDAPRHPDDTPCEHLIPARECRIVGCRGASTDTPEAER